MTSVLNRLLRLSGNRTYIVVFLLLGFLVSSCGTKKTISDSRSTTSRTTSNTSNRATSKVDTIQWNEKKVSSIKSGNVTVMTDQGQDMRGSYNVVMFIPFNTGEYDRSDLVVNGSSEHRFANYYAGAKIAFEELSSKGVNVNLTVLDSEEGEFSDKLSSCKSADVIIGPYNRDQLKQTANFCKQNKIVNISPWQSSSKITEENPFYVQLRPALSKYYDAMIAHALENYRPDQIVLLGRNERSDRARMGHIQKTAAALKGTNSTSKILKEYFIDTDSLINEATTYDEIFNEVGYTTFILPNWSSEDESFIYNSLRKLAAEKMLRQIAVYTMPITLDSENINFDYYSNLNMRIARAKWVDKSNNEVQSFRRKYLRKYNALPGDDAFDGYDMLSFVLTNLWANGKTFQYTLDTDDGQYLQTSYDVQKVFGDKAASLDNFNNINYFENKKVDIIEFSNGKLSRSR